MPESIVTTDGSGNPALSMWKRVMEKVHADLPVAGFEKPGYIVECTFCRDSGMLVTEACEKDLRGDRTITGHVALEDIPIEACSNHKLVDVCGASNHPVTEYCLEQARWQVYQVGMLYVERYYPIGGILVEDQDFNSAFDPRPGFVLPETMAADSMNIKCFIHVEDVEVKTLEELIEEGMEEGRQEREEEAAKNQARENAR